MTAVRLFRLLVPISIALSGIAIEAEDWREFRGPTGQGHSAERGLPLEWSESRNVIWKTPVPGLGWSTPVVAGGRVWLTTAVRERNSASLRVLAFDVQTGVPIINVDAFRLGNAG